MRPPLLVAAAVVALAARAAEVAPPPLRVWHITDVHIDPDYVPGADATSCHCEITHPEGGGTLAATSPQPAHQPATAPSSPTEAPRTPRTVLPAVRATMSCSAPSSSPPPPPASNAAGGSGRPAGTAGVFGNSEGNCATPLSLYDSAIEFMKSSSTGSQHAAGAPLVYFTRATSHRRARATRAMAPST